MPLQEQGNEPLGYALRDGDKTLPEPNPDSSQAFSCFVKLNCHELENLYLTDEVLSELEWSWDAASQEIARESGSFGAKKERLAAAPTWDRRAVDLKGIISEVAKILDRRGVQWTTRLGSILGPDCRPGQLEEFLGPKLVGALWER